MLRRYLLSLPRRWKRLLQIAVDIVLIWAALWLAFIVRLGIHWPIEPLGAHAWLFIAAPLIAIPLFIQFGLYRAVTRFFGSEALLSIFKAVTLSALLMVLAIYWYRDPPVLVPRSLVLNYWALSMLLIAGVRLAIRQYFVGDNLLMPGMPFSRSRRNLPRVAVYGAGAAGNQLVASLRIGRVMQPVAFIDDDAGIVNRSIAGLRVYNPKHIQEMIEATGAEEILLAIPSAPRSKRREILESLERYAVHVRTVPGFMDLASGRVKVDDIQEVDIADLLGRDSVPPRQALLEHCIQKQVVMVTGAGGSIGAELCRQILSCAPSALVLVENSEQNLYSISTELEDRIALEQLDIVLAPVLCSVRNPSRLLDIMQAWRVSTVYHAAAYKHVPIVEHNIAEGLRNNTFGTLNAAQAAIRAGVRNFVLISTDKAVRPTNIMGCSKRLAELVLQALSRETAPILFDTGPQSIQPVENNTRFTMVRFGNVLGSSGSVIPRFHQQIMAGGPVTVTHPRVTRYFMTISEAAQLVIQAGAMGEGGDVFLLDMGQPVRILDLAERMIRLSGLSVRDERNPDGDIAIEFSGLRPGEKLYEELLIGDDSEHTEHPMILRAREEMLEWEALKKVLLELDVAIKNQDYTHIMSSLQGVVKGYESEELVDLIGTHRSQQYERPPA